MPIKLNMCERHIPQLPVVTSKEVLQTKEYLKLAHLTRLSVPRPTFGGGDAGNKHLEVAT
jgi:hypothetical protein